LTVIYLKYKPDPYFVLSRGMVDVQGDQFVAYFLPENETLRKRKRDQEDEKEYTEGDE
jgi:RNA polymerase II-associated factor 1